MMQQPAQIRPLSTTSPFTTAGRVGIVTNGFESVSYSHIVEAASNYLTTRGFQAVVQSKVPLIHDELQSLTALSESACDGLIIHADTLTDTQLEKFMHQHPNAVLLNRHLSLFSDRCVHMDNVLGGAMAARYLLSQGHKRVAMVRGPEHYFEACDRARGFRSELAQNHLELGAELYGNFENEAGESTMERIHDEHPHITAVFYQNDEMAFGALNTCRRLGLKVPEDISIIGFDGVAMIDCISPRLTTVKQPLRQVAEHAAKIVCDLVFNIEPEKRTVGAGYLPELTIGESVAAPGTEPCEKKSALTQRETECLTWTAKGKTSWEISVILGVAESTATFHLRNAGTKLKASNRAHAVAIALHFGLIKLS